MLVCGCKCTPSLFARGVLYLQHEACNRKSLGVIQFLDLQRRVCNVGFYDHLRQNYWSVCFQYGFHHYIRIAPPIVSVRFCSWTNSCISPSEQHIIIYIFIVMARMNKIRHGGNLVLLWLSKRCEEEERNHSCWQLIYLCLYILLIHQYFLNRFFL